MQTTVVSWVGLCIALCVGSVSAQETTSIDGIWSAAAGRVETNAVSTPWDGTLRSYRLASLKPVALQNVLAKAPASAAVRADRSSAVISLPMPDGSFQQFTFVESPVMHPQLAAKYPEIKTYVGQGIDDPHAAVRFDWTPRGFRGLGSLTLRHRVCRAVRARPDRLVRDVLL
jgi:hypothetical protein